MASNIALVLFSICALALADPIRFADVPSPITLSKSVSPSDIPAGRNLYDEKPAVDPERLARYNPLQSIQYHLFTRNNPTVSQPLLVFNNNILQNSNYDTYRRTIMLFHGREGNSTSPFNQALVPAILETVQLNVIVVDWTEGSELGVDGAVLTANSVSQFIRWLMNFAEGYEEDYHLIGLGVGGQVAAISSRLAGRLGHVTALDPPTWREEEDRLRSADSMYTEVVFTTSDGVAPNEQYGMVDFYPNGGKNMPGCGGNWACNHARSYFYMVESYQNRYSFIATECASNVEAQTGDCNLDGRLQMAASYPSYTTWGIFHLETNAAPPFSHISWTPSGESRRGLLQN